MQPCLLCQRKHHTCIVWSQILKLFGPEMVEIWENPGCAVSRWYAISRWHTLRNSTRYTLHQYLWASPPRGTDELGIASRRDDPRAMHGRLYHLSQRTGSPQGSGSIGTYAVIAWQFCAHHPTKLRASNVNGRRSHHQLQGKEKRHAQSPRLQPTLYVYDVEPTSHISLHLAANKRWPTTLTQLTSPHRKS